MTTAAPSSFSVVNRVARCGCRCYIDEREHSEIGPLLGPVLRELNCCGIDIDHHHALSELESRRVRDRGVNLVDRAVGIFIEAMCGAEHMPIGDQGCRTSRREPGKRIHIWQPPADERHAVQIDAERRLPWHHDVASRFVGGDDRPGGTRQRERECNNCRL